MNLPATLPNEANWPMRQLTRVRGQVAKGALHTRVCLKLISLLLAHAVAK
jgi:hypothetical protein